MATMTVRARIIEQLTYSFAEDILSGYAYEYPVTLDDLLARNAAGFTVELAPAVACDATRDTIIRHEGVRLSDVELGAAYLRACRLAGGWEA